MGWAHPSASTEGPEGGVDSLGFCFSCVELAVPAAKPICREGARLAACTVHRLICVHPFGMVIVVAPPGKELVIAKPHPISGITLIIACSYFFP